MYGPAGDLTYEMAYETYCEQIKVLEDAGVDLIAAETMINIEETLAALGCCCIRKFSSCNVYNDRRS